MSGVLVNVSEGWAWRWRVRKRREERRRWNFIVRLKVRFGASLKRICDYSVGKRYIFKKAVFCGFTNAEVSLIVTRFLVHAS